MLILQHVSGQSIVHHRPLNPTKVPFSPALPRRTTLSYTESSVAVSPTDLKLRTKLLPFRCSISHESQSSPAPQSTFPRELEVQDLSAFLPHSLVGLFSDSHSGLQHKTARSPTLTPCTISQNTRSSSNPVQAGNIRRALVTNKQHSKHSFRHVARRVNTQPPPTPQLRRSTAHSTTHNPDNTTSPSTTSQFRSRLPKHATLTYLVPPHPGTSRSKITATGLGIRFLGDDAV